ncbi:MAG: Ig-like domain-containing protein [Bacteroidales bacterium]|nr:Ig-like domain-containing protein [Bacteroidales bacterium]
MPVRIASFILLALLCWTCAQQGSPSGGPRDEDPPIVLECEPSNYSTRFTVKKILITFDEFIVLDNVNQELIVSPPMEEKPEVKLKRKTIVVEFEEALKENTTYTFNFGSAIKDLHEGNKLLNYEYVFSTGDVLDSLSVKGTLKYAEDLTDPEDPISIMLYVDLRDSVPLIDIPLYVGRTDDSGVFSVNNLRPDVYKVFALKDGNNNFLFDLPTEEIGFLDTSLIVNAEFARSLLGISTDTVAMLTDTVAISADTVAISTDTVAMSADTVAISTDTVAMSADTVAMLADTSMISADTTAMSGDSLAAPGPDLNSIYIDMLLFTEASEIQYITDYNRDDPRKLQMMFARPLTDTFRYRSLIPDEGDPVKMIEYFTSDGDSLTLWVVDSIYHKRDTLSVEIAFTMLDTSMQYVTQIDTLVFSYRKQRATKKKEDEEETEEKLVISTIRKGGELDLNRDLSVNLNLPLKGFNDSLISLYHIPDTVEISKPFRTSVDTTLLTRGWISADWESAAQYRMVLLPGAISSIYPVEHDTIDVSFRTRDIEYYGQILLTMENVEHRVLVQLLNKDKVIRQLEADSPGLYTYSYLVPREYRIKVIHDLNRNGKWDTGNYMKKLQPEPVEFLPVDITVRSNWDHDVTITLEK